MVLMEAQEHVTPKGFAQQELGFSKIFTFSRFTDFLLIKLCDERLRLLFCFCVLMQRRV